MQHTGVYDLFLPPPAVEYWANQALVAKGADSEMGRSSSEGEEILGLNLETSSRPVLLGYFGDVW